MREAVDRDPDSTGGGDGHPVVRVTLAGVDFTDAGDDADRVLAVCDDVILSHEPEGDLAVFDREAGTFAAVGDEQDAESVVGSR